MRALGISRLHVSVLLACLGALACGESSSSNGDGDSASGGMGATTSSGGRTTGGASGNGQGGGEDAGAGGDNGGSAGSASGGEGGTSNGGGGGAGQAGMGGTGVGGGGGAPPDDVVSDPPTRLTNVGKAGAGGVLDGLEVTHSHFYVDPEAEPANTWTWLAVVRNHRSDLVCELTVEGSFLNPGSDPIPIFAPVAAPIHRRATTTSVFRCIPPDEIGVASGAALEGPPQVAPNTVTEIQYQITGVLGTDFVPGGWVSISDVEVAAEGTGNVVRGTFTNGSSQMPWWEANVYPMNTRGMPLIEFILQDPRVQLAPGETWDFETPVYDSDFDDAYVFVRHARAE